MRPPAPLLPDRAEWSRLLAASTAAGVLLGLLGPFGSYLNAAAPARVAVWTGLMWGGAACVGSIVRPVRVFAGRAEWPEWVGLALGAAAASVPISVMSALVNGLLWPREVARLGPADWYGETLILTAAFVLGSALFERRARDRQADAELHPAPHASDVRAGRDVGFLDRLPRALGRELIALQMEDHYVRAHTPRGSDLVLLPLRDAVEELGGLEGLRVHRGLSRRAARDGGPGRAAADRTTAATANH